MTTQTKNPINPWTPERLAVQTRQQLETIRANAVRHGVQELVGLCDDELSRKTPTKSRSARRTRPKESESDVVVEYHFVCDRDLGVIDLGDGQFSSGSWVVDEKNVRRSIDHGALLALHETKAQPSYRQGRVVGFKRTSRSMVAKTEDGIEFLVEATDQPLQWFGDGSGEKGYRWASLVNRPSPTDESEGQ